MKKIIPYCALLLFYSCDVDLQIFENDTFGNTSEIDITNNNDTEGDNETDGEPPFTFGLTSSYCYGFSIPLDDKVAEIDIDIDFPESVDLSNFLPPVRSQGQQGSCVAWAAGYYLKSFHENLEDFNAGRPTQNKNIMSPAYIFNQIKVTPCSGSQIPKALELITSTGIVTWLAMPYNEFDCRDLPTEELNDVASENKITSFSYLQADILFEQTKAFLLNQQPIVIALAIDGSFFGVKDEIQGFSGYKEFEEVDGAHAMLVVGYDDTKNAFKAVNSWGTNWGDNGFVWIDYKAFIEANDPDSDFKILCEAWVTEDVLN